MREQFGILPAVVFAAAILGALFSAVPAAAQAGKITGLVVDEVGDPVIGVNVIITGTVRGASTDVDGRYFILNVTRGPTA